MNEASLPTSPDRACRILHIAHCPNGSSSRIVTAVRERRGSVDTCRDVYRGLAMLGQADGADVDAVVLCLDSLSVAGYGFIEEAGRVGKVPIFVYAGRGYELMIPKALELGARGVVEPTADSVAEMLSVVGVADDCPGGNGQAVSSSQAHSSCESVEVATSVRVPWRDDDSRPARTPPSGGGLHGNGAGESQNESPATESGSAYGRHEGDEPVEAGDGAVETGDGAIEAGDGPVEEGEPLPVELSDGPLLSAEEIACLLYDGPPRDDVDGGGSVGQEE